MALTPLTRVQQDQLPLLTSVVVRFGIAYDACHDTGEALLAAYGFRTTNGPGQHEAGRPDAVGRRPRPRALAVTAVVRSGPQTVRNEPSESDDLAPTADFPTLLTPPEGGVADKECRFIVHEG